MEENTRLPNYSECWTNAIKHLKNGCRVLTDSTQSDLALHFTNCFLEMSGLDTVDCVNERSTSLKRLCIKEMPHRAFAAYMEFFTQTQNMCYFLQNQLWHKETENTINSLNSNSRIVSEKLKEASEMQNTLLEFQKQGMEVQIQLLKNNEDLSNSLNISKETLQKLTIDIRESTLEHRTILEELFKEFHLLHNWLVGRYSMIDKIVYFIGSLSLIMIATSVSFTSHSRVYLIGNLLVNFLIEFGLPSLLTLMGANYKIISNSVEYDGYIWMIRKLFIFNSVLIFIYYLFKYEDKFNKQLTLLKEIQSQNRRIMDDILIMKMKSSREIIRSPSKTPPLENIIERTMTTTSQFSSPKQQMSVTTHLPVLMETDNEGDDTVTPPQNFRSVSRASTVSQSSMHYNLRRRTEMFPSTNNNNKIIE